MADNRTFLKRNETTNDKERLTELISTFVSLPDEIQTATLIWLQGVNTALDYKENRTA